MEDKDLNEKEVVATEVIDENKPTERRIRAAVREKYPDFNSEDEAEWIAKEDELYGAMENDMNIYRQSEEQLQDIIKAEPELANVLNDMVVNKMPFRVAIAKHYSTEDLIPQEGEDDYEAYEKQYNERLDKSRKMEERNNEIKANEDATYAVIDEFISEKGLDEDAKESIIEYINTFFSDLINRRITRDMLDLFYNGMNHSTDVAAAREEGEIAGRNANIEAKIEEEDAKEAGDGMPHPSSVSTDVKDNKKETRTFIDDIVERRKKF